MKKILVVFTGGTIGSSLIDHTLNTASENQYRLLTLYLERFDLAREIDFLTIAPVELLSENLVPEIWSKIVTAINAIDQQELAGIIVTHGTDTLAYSACALSYCFATITVPLVMVSSDYPLTDTRANGLENFNAACAFIVQRAEAGVFVAYQNQGQAMQIHLGSRLLSCLPLSGDFMSVQGKAYLKYLSGQFVELNALPIKVKRSKQEWCLKAEFSKRVLLIRPYPGINYSAFKLADIEVVLHDCYHSGTACVNTDLGAEYHLDAFIAQCIENGIAVFLAPAIRSADQYLTTKQLLERGAQMLWNMSLEAAYVKLLLAYANFNDSDERLAFLQENITYEIL